MSSSAGRKSPLPGELIQPPHKRRNLGGEDLVSAEVSTANGNGMPAGCLLPPPSPTRPSTIKPTLPPSPVKSNLKFELSSMYGVADEIKHSIEQTLSSKEQVGEDVENLTRAFKALSEGQTRFRSHIQKSLDSIKEMVGHLAQMKNQQGKHVSTISAGGDHILINPRRLADMNKSPILKKFVDPSIDSIVDHDHEGNMFIDINDSYLRKAIDIQEKDDGVDTMATDHKLNELAADFFQGIEAILPICLHVPRLLSQRNALRNLPTELHISTALLPYS